MFLKYFIVGSFSGFAEFAGAIHPSPEVLGGVDDIVGNVVKDIIELIVGRIGSEVWMLVVGVDLEERVAFSMGIYWLVD